MNLICEHIVGLQQLKGVGRQKTNRLLELITAPQQLCFRELVEIGQTFGMISSQISKAEIVAAGDYTRQLAEECGKLGITCCSYWDEEFPDSLRFSDHPALVFYKGDLRILTHSKRAAVIGSRQPSALGADFAFQAGKLLAENNFVVISGLAIGSDSYGHQGCLDAGGKTVAFLPSGLAPVYPSANQQLAEEICAMGGCLVSEYSHHEPFQPYKFIERDRLQSAASQFVIVSNFSPGSGTIYTLDYARKYQKAIYSIPVIYSESRAGFKHLETKQIDYRILSNTELTDVIEQF
ncbi:DNA-processing protein DprA [Acetobacterium wieringae]|uniref:DNA-processing protein DprA n=1 Tax=Acetobacterium wieringae TaxID=52694 RepID=UPI0026ED0DC7|nr:DNA-processing protein DprA [Acetobacterium wieringae]